MDDSVNVGALYLVNRVIEESRSSTPFYASATI